MSYYSDLKLVVAGNFVELYQYSKPFAYCLSPLKKRHREQKKKENKKRSSKLKSTFALRGLVNSNPQLNIFLTLTFAENVKDLTVANYEFNKFIKRCKYQYGKFDYICVVEFQKRGAVHYHIVWSLPTIPLKDLQELWGKGFIWLTRCRVIKNIGAYFAKHGTKKENDVVESEKLAGRKKFFSSRGLKRPTVLRDFDEINAFREKYLIGLKPFFEKDAQYDDLRVNYRQYKIKPENSSIKTTDLFGFFD